MNRIFCFLALTAAVVATSFAQSPPGAVAEITKPSFAINVKLQEPPPEPTWSFSGFYGFKTERFYATVGNKLDTIEDILGQKWLDLDLNVFAGANQDAGIVGGSLTYNVPLAKSITGSLGFGLAKRGESINDFFTDLKDIEFGFNAAIMYWTKF